MVQFERVISVSYQLPIVTKALSLTVFAEPSNVTDGQTDGRTDGRTDRISMTYVDLMLRATRYHRSQKYDVIVQFIAAAIGLSAVTRGSLL